MKVIGPRDNKSPFSHGLEQNLFTDFFKQTVRDAPIAIFLDNTDFLFLKSLIPILSDSDFFFF